jgi:hypothetical protein
MRWPWNTHPCYLQGELPKTRAAGDEPQKEEQNLLLVIPMNLIEVLGRKPLNLSGDLQTRPDLGIIGSIVLFQKRDR